jgi:uncharacterized protein (TIGR02246 family)
MKASTLLPAGIALAFLLAGCAPATPPAAPDTRDADAAAIRQVEANWLQAESTKDADKITAFYADDASLLLPDMPVVTGKANIEAAYKTFLADKNFSLTWTPSTNVVVSKSSDMAYSEGAYTMTYTDPKTKKAVTENGKYAEVYMKQADGSWKNVVDTGNEDAPPTPVKAK